MYDSYSRPDTDATYLSGPTYPPVPPPPVKKGLGAGAVIAIALVCSILGGILGASAVTALDYFRYKPNESVIYEGDREIVELSATRVDTSKEMTVAELYAQNVNSTVGIATSVTSTNYWGYSTTKAASGSGFIYTKDGYILTNHHVIENASSVTVSMYDGTTYPATIVGYDKSNDIAVLKIEAENLTPVVIGNSDHVNVGDTVVAIGNPLGELTFSLTAGVVSALNREVTFSNGVSMDLIQTDCAINSGNSGGALFNLYGEVVGITNAKYSSTGSSGEASIDNIGFAIPMNTVRNIVDSLIEKGYISKPYIGVSIVTVSDEIRGYGLPAGASIQSVTPDSPAERAGLQVNDIVTAIDGNPITSSDQLVDYVGKKLPNDVIQLTIYRNGALLTISVTVGETITSGIGTNTQQNTQNTLPNNGFPGQDFGGSYRDFFGY